MLIVLTVVVIISNCEDVVSGSLEEDDPHGVVNSDSVDSYVLVNDVVVDGDDDASVTLLSSVLKEADDVSMYPLVVIVDSRNRSNVKTNRNSYGSVLPIVIASVLNKVGDTSVESPFVVKSEIVEL